MKKIFSLIVMALFGSAMLFSQIVLTRGGRVLYDVALENADSITFATDAQGELLEAMSPTEQREKLVSVAADFIDMFKPKDHRDLIELLNYLVEKYNGYSWEPFVENLERESSFLPQLVRAIKVMDEGDITHNLAMEIYDFPRFTGIFEANDEERVWKYLGESESIELRFKNQMGDSCTAILAGRGEAMELEFDVPTDSVASKTWVEKEGYEDRLLVYFEEQINHGYGRYVSFYDEDGVLLFCNYYETGQVIPAHYDYKVVVTNGYYEYEYYTQPQKVVLPANITFFLKEADVEHIAFEMNLDVEKAVHVKYDMNLRVANISIVNNLSVSGKDALVDFAVTIDDEPLISAKVVLPALVLLDKSSDESFIDWWLEYAIRDDRWGSVEDVEENKNYNHPLERVKTGFVIAEIDFLNQMQIKASSRDVVGLYRGMNKIDSYFSEKDGADYYYLWYDYNKAMADWLNKNLQVGVYYNSPVQQAELQMEVVLKGLTDSYPADAVVDTVEEYALRAAKNKTYTTQLVLYFPQNGTTYEFDDYFTTVAFGSLLDMISHLAENYGKLLEYNGIGAEDALSDYMAK